jgi:hypothetical protein
LLPTRSETIAREPLPGDEEELKAARRELRRRERAAVPGDEEILRVSRAEVRRWERRVARQRKGGSYGRDT